MVAPQEHAVVRNASNNGDRSLPKQQRVVIDSSVPAIHDIYDHVCQTLK